MTSNDTSKASVSNDIRKSREWILRKGDHRPTEITGRMDMLYNGQDYIHVCEVVPGSVQITREDFQAAAIRSFGTIHGPESSALQYMEERLFKAD